VLNLDNHISSILNAVTRRRADEWTHFFEKLIHATDTVCSDPACAYQAQPAYLKACRANMEHLYIPTRDKLRMQTQPIESQQLQLWEQFAAALGISEEELLNKWMRERKCCYPSCTMRSTGKASKMGKCSHCQTVYYHDRFCQKAYANRRSHYLGVC
jgi:hypothetical protein